jgi:hypothetical protein
VKRKGKEAMLNPSRIRTDYQEFRYTDLMAPRKKARSQFWAKPLALVLCGFLFGIVLHGTTLSAKGSKQSVETVQTAK